MSNPSMTTPKGTILPILDLRGKPYLQVPHRIVWFREDHPDWIMEVTFPILNEAMAMARAEIRDADGKVKAVAHKVEHKAHFTDFIEKAETSSIGRALAMIGYGTQFAPELEEGERLADAPTTTAKKQNQTSKVKSQEKQAIENPFEEEKIEQEKLSHDPGEYVVKLGQFKGMRLKDVNIHKLDEYIEWIKESAHQTGKPLSGNGFELVEFATAYLKTKEFER